MEVYASSIQYQNQCNCSERAHLRALSKIWFLKLVPLMRNDAHAAGKCAANLQKVSEKF